MALQKQPVSINFSKGLDTKSDPYQVQVGNFLSLQNSVFTKAGRLTKRDGFRNVTRLPNTDETTLTTLNDNLIATGSNLYAFSQDTNQWLNQGLVQPVSLSVQPMVRVTTGQTSPDTAVASSGLTCLVYMDNSLSYYQVSDSITGQQIVSRVLLPNAAQDPRVFILGAFYIITFIANVASVPTLQYISVPIMNPSAPNTAVTISTDIKSIHAGYDAYVDTNLYIAWGMSTAAVHLTYLTPGLALAGGTTLAGSSADLMSVSADAANNIIWITFWDTGTNNGFTAAYNTVLGNLVTSTPIIVSTEIQALTSVVVDQVVNVFYENVNNYSYLDSIGDSIRTDFISKLTVTRPIGIGAGTVSSTTVMLRSVGLASKAFLNNGDIYMLVEYGDLSQTNPLDNSNQPLYMLVDSTGDIIMRLAYANGGGYAANQVLPNVSSLDDFYYAPYLVTDFLAPVNKGTNLPAGTPVNAIYTQKGVNLAKFSIDNSGQHSSEIAGALHLTGGQLWEYDGVRPVEHGFHVYPENVVITGSSSTPSSMTAQTYFYTFTYEWTDNQGMLHRSAPSIPIQAVISTPPATFTGTRTSGSAVLGSVSSFTGLQVGQHVTGTGIPANTFILSLSPGTSQLTLTQNATSGTATVTTVSVSALTALAINVPTLRLTYKLPPNPVRIVGYRWSTAQQTYYQFTSVTAPTLNDTTIDSVTLVDTKSDAQILGQTLLYTTGGVIENIAAPASVASALFSNRLFLIDAEDQNLLWFSKQVIESVPVEMSDLLTLFVAPTTGAQGSTGPMTALGAMDDKLIVFKKDAIYYINGSGPDNTGANSTFSDPVFVTSTVGSSNPNSIVLMPNGIMFQSDKGIWLLGRDLATNYIGAPVEQYNDSIVMSATAVPGTNQVRFVLDNNVTLMYDYFFNQWATHTNVSAISATLYQSKHTYLNTLGQIFQEAEGTFIDGSIPVLMSLVTSWLNIAGLQGYERFYFANLLGTYYTPFKLNVQFAYDYNSSPTKAVIVTPNNFSAPWGGEALWGSGGPWGGPGNVFTARIFPEKQKCQAFQVTIQEIYDSSLGQQAGQGLSLSGLALVVGMKKGYRTQSARKSFG